MRIVFFGSGEFGLPTLEALAASPGDYSIPLVVSQPDKPAGRSQRLTPTPVAAWATARQVPCLKPRDVNTTDEIAAISALGADAFVVIAFGQKLSPALLGDTFSINLHSSLLPRYRGAAPIQRAMMAGDEKTGLTVISLAQQMDAGLVYATLNTPISPDETAGELHDRLASLGPELVIQVLQQHQLGRLRGLPQDESRASHARKLRKEEGTTDFATDCRLIRARIHGLNPWPGCAVVSETGETLRIGRVCQRPDVGHVSLPGTLIGAGLVACATGAVQIREIQAPGGKMMDLSSFLRGRGELLPAGSRLRPLTPPGGTS